METKVCNKCNENKNVCEFGNSKTSDDGFLYCCKKCNNERSKQYREKNPEKSKESSKNYRIKNVEERRKKSVQYYIDNKDKILKSSKLLRESYKPKRAIRRKERRKTDVIYGLVNDVRYRIWFYLKSHNITKKNKTFEIVGCSPKFLKEHLETQFTDGMTWDNRSEWHIDHIIPLSSAKTEDELYKLCHYENLQPLWAEDNLKKSNKLVVII
jgi:HNH endonuclease